MKNVLVIGHERSGNHFLQNTITLNFNKLEYGTWIDFPNTFDGKALYDFLNYVEKINKIFKSHHQYTSLKPFWNIIRNKFTIFYIIRDGRDVLTSLYFHYLKRTWITDKTFSKFLLLKPEPKNSFVFNCYNDIITENMIARWKWHVEEWVKVKNINFVRYEDLKLNFKETLERIENILKVKADNCIVPELGHKSIDPRLGIIGDYKNYFNQKDLDLFAKIAGDLNRSLGYE